MQTTNPTIPETVRAYFEHRGLTAPDAGQALLFLVSEVGELADAFVEEQAQWVRNNPERNRNVSDEIGDVLMMLTVFADAQGIDPLDAMLAKFERKGFSPNGNNGTD
jgi:NTP pyrophosphatase (non-canonical NTP hydrolase)